MRRALAVTALLSGVAVATTFYRAEASGGIHRAEAEGRMPRAEAEGWMHRAEAEGGGGQQRFKAGVDLIHFSVVVTDKQGAPIIGLKPEDFEVVEEGKPQSITYFMEGNPDDGSKLAEVLPLRLGLALDSSGSMDRDITDVRTGIIKFLLANEHAVDFTLVDFDTEVRVTRYGPDDYRATDRAHPAAQARRLDGALRRARRLSEQRRRGRTARRSCVIYTDGGDTRSELTLADLLDLLKASDVTVYAIGYLEHQPGSARSMQQSSLQRMSAITGGQAFFPTQHQGAREDLREDPARDRRALQPRLHVHGHAQGRRVAEGGDQAEAARSEGRQAAHAGRVLRPVPRRQPLTP